MVCRIPSMNSSAMMRPIRSFCFQEELPCPTVAINRDGKSNSENGDLADIDKNFDLFVEYISPRVDRNGMVKYKNESNSYTTRGVSESYQFAERTIMMKGRYLNVEDIKNKNKYAVIGRLVEQDLFGQENALGSYIDISESMFKVIGVFQDGCG